MKTDFVVYSGLCLVSNQQITEFCSGSESRFYKLIFNKSESLLGHLWISLHCQT